MSDDTLSAESLDTEDARALIAALNADLTARYPNPVDNFFELDAGEVDGTHGVFLVARSSGAAVGCGAVRLLDAGGDRPGAAEVKRMYVAPEARGRGLAARILLELERWARDHGAKELVLEMGAAQPEALAVYRRAGFEAIPRFGAYASAPESLCFAKPIDRGAR